MNPFLLAKTCKVESRVYLPCIRVERALDDHENYIRRRVEIDRVSHRQLSEDLKEFFSGESRGLSVRSIPQRFCQEKGIHRTSRLSDDAVKRVVTEAVAKVSIGARVNV